MTQPLNLSTDDKNVDYERFAPSYVRPVPLFNPARHSDAQPVLTLLPDPLDHHRPEALD